MAYHINENYDADVTEEIAGHYREILRLIGETPERDGLLKTPQRAAKAIQFLTKGYSEDGEAILRSAVFDLDDEPGGGEMYRGNDGSRVPADSRGKMVIVKDIDFSSLCEHHLMPFAGKAHVAYIPKGKIVGLSKIARVVECYARRLQVQERLTGQICSCIYGALDTEGVAVALEASHSCMTLRGVQKPGSLTFTTSFCGRFAEDAGLRGEFYKIVKK